MSSMSLNVDEVIGSGENAYVILGELGRGASGVVYKARPVGRPDELVALKLIDGIGNLDTQLVEPEILSRLKHPNIIRLADYFLVSGKLALAMEYVDGPDLNGWAESHGRLSSADVRVFLTQMAQALLCAHAQGVIHRDIKPGNIMVAREGDKPHYILADFGISRQVEGIQLKKQFAGSYRFMAPEQLQGRATPQSDLWSLGVVAYWLLSGSLPFDGTSLRELTDQIALMSPPAPSTVVGNVDGALETVVLELIQKDTLLRVDSATTLLDRLDAKPLHEAETTTTAANKIPSWEITLSRTLRRRQIAFWFCFLLWMLPGLFIGPAVTALGLHSLYLQQLRLRRAGHAALGLLLILTGCVLWVVSVYAVIIITSNNNPKAPAPPLVSAWICSVFFASPVFGLIATHHFTKMRRLERDRFFLRSLRNFGSHDQSVIEILRGYLERNPEELFVRQRLAELYLYAGRLKEAVVESKIILSIDGYNFSASLLLGEAYARLGLIREAVAVCDGYLAISPQSFEFDELRKRCLILREHAPR